MPKHIKEVLENCINYDVIVGYESSNNDCLTQILIKFYQDYVFYNWSSIDNIKILDTIIYEYIINNDFNNYLHDKYQGQEEILIVFDVLVELFNDFEKNKMKMIEETSWI
jgi:hypothetical protein